MIWHFLNTYEELSIKLADEVFELIRQAQTINIGISTGFSPTSTYKYISEHLGKTAREREKIKVVQLDEWCGLLPEDSSSCNAYMQRHVIGAWKLSSDQVLSIDGTKSELAISKMNAFFINSRLDVCISGLGRNGHLALNEPGSSSEVSCRIVELNKASQGHNMLSDIAIKPKQGITIGIKEILKSKRIDLIVTGEGKREAYSILKTGKITSDYPVTFLHSHSNVHCYIDTSSVS